MNNQNDGVRTRVLGVLNRNWIDVDRARLICMEGKILLKGKLCRKGPRAEMAARSIASLEKELTETRGVRRVDLNLSNWERSPEGGWRPKQAG